MLVQSQTKVVAQSGCLQCLVNTDHVIPPPCQARSYNRQHEGAPHTTLVRIERDDCAAGHCYVNLGSEGVTRGSGSGSKIGQSGSQAGACGSKPTRSCATRLISSSNGK